MTVRELKEILDKQDENMEVVMLPANFTYVYSIRGTMKKMVRSFWGADMEAVVIAADDQIGAV